MGACFIVAEIRARKESSLKSKFKKMVKAYKAEYGNNPYSGTWSVVPGVRVVSYPNAPKRWTDKSKFEAANYLETKCQKWEDALAIKTTNSYIVAAWAAS